MKTKMEELIEKTREYINYIEEHYNAVQKAWILIQDKCKPMRFMVDDYYYETIGLHIRNHDVSKLSTEEFVPYREAFYPVPKDKYINVVEVAQEKAWDHHKRENTHHWERIAEGRLNHVDSEIAIVEMVCDWVAMEYQGKTPAREYYNQHIKQHLTTTDNEFICKIFDHIYGIQENSDE